MLLNGGVQILLHIAKGDAYFIEMLREVDSEGNTIYASNMPFVNLVDLAIERINSHNRRVMGAPASSAKRGINAVVINRFLTKLGKKDEHT